MPLSHEHVGSKIPAKIQIYILSRAELLITLCYEIPCNFDASRSTFFYNHKKNSWTDGPSLWQGRIKHAAGVVTDEVTNEKLIVTTGGSNYGFFLDSIEVLFENQWHIGKELAEMLMYI